MGFCGLSLCLKQCSPEHLARPFTSDSVIILHLPGLEALPQYNPVCRQLRSLLSLSHGFPWVLLFGSRFPRAACVYSLEITFY